MELVRGRVHVGVPAPEGSTRFDDIDGFLDRLDDIGATHGAAIQAFDARYLAGRDHVRRAVALARRAHERDDGIARDRSVEILLYAAGRRQIERALEMGVDEGVTPAVVAIDGGDEAAAARAAGALLEPDDDIDLGDTERLRTFFDIGDRELAATDASLEALVCERVALLVVEK